MAERYGVSGGCGYVGYRLALALLRQQGQATVRLLDIRPPLHSPHGDASPARASSPFPSHPSHLSPSEASRLSFHHCDLTSAASVLAGLEGVSCVYHVASFGMSGAEMMDVTTTAAVNVAGTAHILAACRQHRIPRLVYVSSYASTSHSTTSGFSLARSLTCPAVLCVLRYNAVYNGGRIVGGDESLPYPPLLSHTDTYSRTKTIAEQMVRSASHDALNPLRVCVVRPAAIYGDGEQRHLPRILRLVQRGLGVFAIGSADVLCDWVYCDNLVHALVLGSRRLREDGRLQLPISTSRVYCVSDDAPTNNFAFLQRIIRPLNLPPTFLFYVPTALMLRVAHGIEVSHRVATRWLPARLQFAPFLTRAEVLKVGREHWMRMDRAKNELGWEVVVDREEAVRRCVDWYGRAGYGRGAEWETMAGKQKREKRWTATVLGPIVAILLVLLSALLLPQTYTTT